MKKLLVRLAAITAAFVSFSTARAGISVTTGVWDKYLSDNSAVFLTKPVWQTVYAGSVNEDLSWSIFHSVGLDDSKLSSNFGDEIDFTLKHQSRFGELKQFTLGTQVSYWDCHKLFSAKPADVVAGTVTLSRSIFPGGTGSVTFDQYVSTNLKVFDSGCRVTLKVNAAVPISENLSLSFAPAIMRDDGAFHLEPAWIGQASIALEWKAGRATIHFPKANLTKPFSRTHDGRGSEIAWGGGASFSF